VMVMVMVMELGWKLAANSLESRSLHHRMRKAGVTAS